MGVLSKRGGDRVPVQARRAGVGANGEQSMEPVVIQVPAGQPVPATPPPQPGVTQNIVYIVAPPGQGAPPVPPAAPSPQEVHYHTTHNYAPTKRRHEKGTSFFGTLAVMAGLLACACAYVPPVANYVKVIAEAGLALGALGFLSATLFRRAGRGVPAVGIMISAIAFPIWLSRTGQLQSQYDQLRSKSPVGLPAVDFSNGTGTAPTTPGSETAPGSTPGGSTHADRATPSDASHRGNDHSIFGDSGQWQKPDDVTIPPKPHTSLASGQPGSTRGSGGQAPSVFTNRGDAIDGRGESSGPPSPEMAQALSRLETARQAAGRRRGVDYTGVESAASAATTAYQQAKMKYDLKTPELIDAAQKELAATSELHELQKTLDNDPDVAAAEQAVRAIGFH